MSVRNHRKAHQKARWRVLLKVIQRMESRRTTWAKRGPKRFSSRCQRIKIPHSIDISPLILPKFPTISPSWLWMSPPLYMTSCSQMHLLSLGSWFWIRHVNACVVVHNGFHIKFSFSMSTGWQSNMSTRARPFNLVVGSPSLPRTESTCRCRWVESCFWLAAVLWILVFLCWHQVLSWNNCILWSIWESSKFVFELWMSWYPSSRSTVIWQFPFLIFQHMHIMILFGESFHTRIFGWTRILKSLQLPACWPWSHNILEISSRVSSRYPMIRQPPPQWLIRWRQILHLVLNLEYTALQWMSRMVRLGIANRSWMTLREQFQLQQEQQALATSMKSPQYHPTECSHPEWKRYGNRTGSYARCTLCHTRRQWDHQGKQWVEIGLAQSASSSLPLPSPSNTSQDSSRPPRATTSKAKAKPYPKSAFPPSSPIASTGPSTQRVMEIPPEVLADLARVTPENIMNIHQEQLQRVLQLVQESQQESQQMPEMYDMDWQETASGADLYEWQEEDLRWLMVSENTSSARSRNPGMPLMRRCKLMRRWRQPIASIATR